MKRFVIWLVAIVLLPAAGFAQESDAWSLIQKGQKHVERGRLAQALSSFKQAIELEPRNGTAINAAAQVASFMELPAESLFYYTAYLYLEAEYMGDAETVKQAMAKQASLLENPPTLQVNVLPDDGELVVNGVPLGKGRFTLPAEAGKPYDIAVKVDDYHPHAETVILQPGEAREVTIRLKKIIYYGKVNLKVLPGDDVKVYVDTKFVGTSIGDVEAVEGKRLLCFKKEGFDRWWRYVNVPRNDSVQLEVMLRNQSRPDGPCTVWPEEEGY